MCLICTSKANELISQQIKVLWSYLFITVTTMGNRGGAGSIFLWPHSKKVPGSRLPANRSLSLGSLHVLPVPLFSPHLFLLLMSALWSTGDLSPNPEPSKDERYCNEYLFILHCQCKHASRQLALRISQRYWRWCLKENGGKMIFWPKHSGGSLYIFTVVLYDRLGMVY